MKISLLINMKLPTFVGILIFISRKKNSCSAVLSMKKSFIASGPEHQQILFLFSGKQSTSQNGIRESTFSQEKSHLRLENTLSDKAPRF